MDQIVFKILKSKKIFTSDDIRIVLLLCERLFERNEQMGIELGKALENIESLTNRINFYRNTTMRILK